MEQIDVSVNEDYVEKTHYDAEQDKLVVETTYDAAPAIERNELIRQSGGLVLGSKNQQLIHIGSVNIGDIVRLKALGYDLLSADPAESHRAVLYLRDHEQKFITRPDVIADKKVIWR
jgi:hypothetical protein